MNLSLGPLVSSLNLILLHCKNSSLESRFPQRLKVTIHINITLDYIDGGDIMTLTDGDVTNLTSN